MHKTKSILFLIVLICGFPYVSYPQSTLSAGGETIILPGGGTLQTTVGESVVLTIESDNFVFTQGQQQPDPLEVQAIPTMGEWGIMILLLLLLNIAVVAIKGSKNINSNNNQVFQHQKIMDRK